MNSLLEAERPAVFFMNGIGDTFINLPALRALTRLFKGRMSLICARSSASCILDELEVRRSIPVSFRTGECGKDFQVDEVAEAVGGCDFFLSLVPWHSPSLKSLRSQLRPHRTLGFFESYDIALKLDFAKHSAELAFDAVRYLNPLCKIEDFTAPHSFPAAAQAQAQRLLEPLDPALRLLAVHADTKSEKMWNTPSWRVVLDEFLGRHPDFVALLLGWEPQPLDAGPRADRIIPCYGISLATSLSLVSQADLFLGVDSCMLHAADLARVPGVVLFGPTCAGEFGFLVGSNVTVQANEKTEEIQPEMVLQALESILSDPLQNSLWKVADWTQLTTATG